MNGPNRGVAAVAVISGFLLLAGAASVLFAGGDAAVEPGREQVALPGPVVLTPRPALVEVTRTSFETGRVRRDDLPTVQLKDLDNPKDIHRQAVLEIRGKALQPCSPRPKLTAESIETRRLEVDYLLQPTGIVEIQLRGVDDQRAEEPVDPLFLDCVASKLGELEGPAVQGQVQHRFVFAYRTSG